MESIAKLLENNLPGSLIFFTIVGLGVVGMLNSDEDDDEADKKTQPVTVTDDIPYMPKFASIDDEIEWLRKRATYLEKAKEKAPGREAALLQATESLTRLTEELRLLIIETQTDFVVQKGNDEDDETIDNKETLPLDISGTDAVRDDSGSDGTGNGQQHS